jgi:hypothetical protein
MSLNENNLLFDINLDGKSYGVFFYGQENHVFSASKIYKAFCIFDSPYIEGTEGFASWNNIEMDYEKNSTSTIYTYVKNYENEEEETQAEWVGPFLNSNHDISNMSKKYIKVRIVLSTTYENPTSPVINSLKVGLYKLSGEEVFFTKTFNLGFKPKNIILTYNGSIQDETVVNFAISGKDSSNPSDFTNIKTNSIEDIWSLPSIGNKLKIMLSGMGNRNIPFVIDEFAFAISGEKQTIIT